MSPRLGYLELTIFILCTSHPWLLSTWHSATLQPPLSELYRTWELLPLKLAMEAVGSSDEQTATMEFSKETFDLESNTRFEYDPWLLDDHPLRSYPTECIPGLSLYLDEYYESIGKRRAILFRAACLILGCL